ncbi:hypothetical protein GCM10007852_16080 [Agaribacter marinus]|uniref:Uncharacterized protein n=1 Tax=Agaribacter marinus TaxID=1431249 RepID=A0AA37WK69_9ALTE|nr:hypothetical protein GCM10007852_16080 [Agaribacter marinus]
MAFTLYINYPNTSARRVCHDVVSAPNIDNLFTVWRYLRGGSDFEVKDIFWLKNI